MPKEQKTIKELFKRLNLSVEKTKDVENAVKETKESVKDILKDDKVAIKLIHFAESAYKTIKKAEGDLDEEENVILITKMMAFVLAMLERDKLINIKH